MMHALAATFFILSGAAALDLIVTMAADYRHKALAALSTLSTRSFDA